MGPYSSVSQIEVKFSWAKDEVDEHNLRLFYIFSCAVAI
jgi:hypothetical protein